MFKEGDKVICIRGSSSTLLQGAVYTILGYHEGNYDKVILRECARYNWFTNRFVLLTPLTEALV